MIRQKAVTQILSFCLHIRRMTKMNYCDVQTIARQRLGKHIPVGANARNNKTSIARQRISKHA
jgi:hypothetical protein